MGCKKDSLPEGDYTGNFWGEYRTMTDTVEHYILDLNMTLSSTDGGVLVNDHSFLGMNGDSIYGTIEMNDTAYLINPYIIGVWEKDKKEYTIEGNYSAVKGTVTTINGPFEIRKNL